MKRLDFVLFRGAYSEMMTAIDGANKELREFVHESKDLEPIRRKRRSGRTQENFKLIRKQAKSLYNVVVKGKSWTCRCKTDHTASLLLQPRPRSLVLSDVATTQ